MYSGFALSTLFEINCIGWIDIDGKIVAYEYLGINFFIKNKGKKN